MLKAIFGSSSVPFALKQGLDRTMESHKRIADSVARTIASSTQSGNASAAGGSGNLVDDMASLADTQIRYETEARLLRAVYDQLRSTFRG